MRTGTDVAAAARWPSAHAEDIGEHNGTVEDDASTPPADAVNPATMMLRCEDPRVTHVDQPTTASRQVSNVSPSGSGREHRDGTGISSQDVDVDRGTNEIAALHVDRYL